MVCSLLGHLPWVVACCYLKTLSKLQVLNSILLVKEFLRVPFSSKKPFIFFEVGGRGWWDLGVGPCKKKKWLVNLTKFDVRFYGSVLLLIICCVITLSKWLWNHELQASVSTVNFDNAMTIFIFNKRTDAQKLTPICFLQ